MFVEQTERKVERKCTVFIKIHPRIPIISPIAILLSGILVFPSGTGPNASFSHIPLMWKKFDSHFFFKRKQNYKKVIFTLNSFPFFLLNLTFSFFLLTCTGWGFSLKIDEMRTLSRSQSIWASLRPAGPTIPRRWTKICSWWSSKVWLWRCSVFVLINNIPIYILLPNGSWFL